MVFFQNPDACFAKDASGWFHTEVVLHSSLGALVLRFEHERCRAAVFKFSHSGQQGVWLLGVPPCLSVVSLREQVLAFVGEMTHDHFHSGGI